VKKKKTSEPNFQSFGHDVVSVIHDTPGMHPIYSPGRIHAITFSLQRTPVPGKVVLVLFVFVCLFYSFFGRGKEGLRCPGHKEYCKRNAKYFQRLHVEEDDSRERWLLP
jgi:hypothetical protein